jgi:hypothetical protein
MSEKTVPSTAETVETPETPSKIRRYAKIAAIGAATAATGLIIAWAVRNGSDDLDGEEIETSTDTDSAE